MTGDERPLECAPVIPIDQKLALLSTLGVDCIAIDMPDGQRGDAAIDLSTPESATAFFKAAKAKVAAHGMELRTVLATSGLEEIKRGISGREQKIASLLNAVHAMGAAGALEFATAYAKGLGRDP